MKKYLLPKAGNFYKANLHCHTTVSDGKRTPEEIKKVYMAKGYSVVAYTDHNKLVVHNDLTDSDFLALNGLELDICDESKVASFKKTCHMCFIAKDGNNHIQPCYHTGACLEKNENGDKWSCLVKIDECDEYEDAEYSPDYINKITKAVKDKGFFITYNHPTWSRENYTDYINYKNLDAFEMFNGGSYISGYDEYNPRVYEDFLNSGQKIYCIGGDDNHTYRTDIIRGDEGVAFTVIKAEKLTYPAVIKALENGDFYSSMGPEIHELYYEDGKVHIKCSEADRIALNCQVRCARVAYAESDKPVTEAVFELPKNFGYFRITVTDKSGMRACTNAYFEEDLI